jgi:threonylcarbamoyladenosine tRNA methylthiotransferase MtaB
LKTTCASSIRNSPRHDRAAETAAVLTAGCRLNQSESDALRQRLRQQGVVLVADPAQADTCFVNTCTVTSAADRSSVQLIRRVCRLLPKPRVVVMGCMVERSRAAAGRIAGVDEVWDNVRKQAEVDGCTPAPNRSRALLKVQDGCARRCSYCVVSGLRGTPRSIPAAVVCRQFEQLLAEGFHETVLTGLNLGTYRDARGVSLAGLLGRLLALPGRYRIRLGSIEPDTIDGGLIDTISDAKVCPHFHVPLQSGDDALLEAMRRPYSTVEYGRLLDRLVSARPDACIGADVLVGFPGEGSASFEGTKSFISQVPVSYLHVFSFSPRPGTAAATGSGAPERSTVRARVKQLREISEQSRHEYQRRFVRTVRQAVVETNRSALTDNYLRLAVECAGSLRPGVLADFLIEQNGAGLTGTPLRVMDECVSPALEETVGERWPKEES